MSITKILFNHFTKLSEGSLAYLFVSLATYLKKLRLLQSFLHYYDDDDCIKILNKCREAIPAKGRKLIIVEIVVDIDETLHGLRIGRVWGQGENEG